MAKKILEINGIDVTRMILNGMDYERNKLWADDTGRLLNGNFIGTLIGIFPKLVFSFYPENEDDLSTLMALLDSPIQSIRYYSLKEKALVDLGTYTSDYKVPVKTFSTYAIEPIKVSFISTRKE